MSDKAEQVLIYDWLKNFFKFVPATVHEDGCSTCCEDIPKYAWCIVPYERWED